LHYSALMKKTVQSEKLTKADPEFYSKIAALSGKKLLRQHGTDYFSKLAAKSHPRAEYHGGRPKKAVEIPVRGKKSEPRVKKSKAA
jgi:hypothetical protein